MDNLSSPPGYGGRYAEERIRSSGMKQSPRRTFETTLTDDELLLFDVMFDGNSSFRSLRRETFETRWMWHPHNLTDAQLQETLASLVESGLLSIERHDGREYFQLTPDGGNKWEAERLPDWHRYATERYGETPSGRSVVTIVATSPEIRNDFWRIGCDVEMFAYTNGRIKRSTITNHVLIPWKTFPSLHVLVAVLDDWWASTDWLALETRRTWWRVVRESYKFWPQSA
ncbi:MAG: hypothetical protein KDB23_00145 [Planctomycetales bacterium]|nr:hypothetical protein [Planctomycetales bacterium]